MSVFLQPTVVTANEWPVALASNDGAYTLEFSGQSQTRYLLNLGDEPVNGNDSTNGFTQPRTAIRLDGTVANGMSFGVQAVFDVAGAFVLEEAAISFELDEQWSLSLGTLALPVLTEDAVFDYYGQAVDQSIVNLVFGQGDSEGVILTREVDTSRLSFGFSDGLNSIATDFNDDLTDAAFTLRADMKSEDADWSVFDEFPSFRGSDFAWRLGTTAHYETGDVAGGNRELFQYTVDIHLKANGWNIFAACVGRTLDSPGERKFTDLGFVAQGGLFVIDDLEPFVRFAWLQPDDDRVGNEDVHATTTGVTWYVHGHAMKCTLDCVHVLDATESNELIEGGDPSVGILADAGEQTVLRFQIQLLF